MVKSVWKFYKDKAGEWRWSQTASNGKVVGASTEGYKNRKDCYKNAIVNGYNTINISEKINWIFVFSVALIVVTIWVVMN